MCLLQYVNVRACVTLRYVEFRPTYLTYIHAYITHTYIHTYTHTYLLTYLLTYLHSGL